MYMYSNEYLAHLLVMILDNPSTIKSVNATAFLEMLERGFVTSDIRITDSGREFCEYYNAGVFA